MRRVSIKRARQLREYTRLRREFLEARPVCEFPGEFSEGCRRRAVVIHHRRGRQGERLCDVTWWAASCVEHNDYAETHTGAALALGWLVRIESVA